MILPVSPHRAVTFLTTCLSFVVVQTSSLSRVQPFRAVPPDPQSKEPSQGCTSSNLAGLTFPAAKRPLCRGMFKPAPYRARRLRAITLPFSQSKLS